LALPVVGGLLKPPFAASALLTTAKAANPTVYAAAKRAMMATLLHCPLRIDLLLVDFKS
jgi:hypothetical protein